MSGRNLSMTNGAAWPQDIDIDHIYSECRLRLERAVENSTDMTNWNAVQTKSDVRLYQHERNSSNQQCAMRIVVQVPGTVHSAVEMLRLLDSASFRVSMKEIHGKTFIDGEVLHSDIRRNEESESLALKWFALNTGTMFTKPKEFLYYEYCSVFNSRKYGPVGMCYFESYDGIGAKYGIRARPDSYKLATFEPSYFVMTPSNELGNTVITLTVTSKKAGGSNLVSSALKTLMQKFTSHYSSLDALARTSNQTIPLKSIAHVTPVVDLAQRKISSGHPSQPPRNEHVSLERSSSGDTPIRVSGGVPSMHTRGSSPRSSTNSSTSSEPRKKKNGSHSKRQEYINDDFQEICYSAMQVLNCPMAGIRTRLFELVHYSENINPADMPKSMPTFRRMAQSGKPCVVLDVNSDKRISVDRRQSSRLQFFVGVPLILSTGECIGDICVADTKPRKVIDYNALEILKVLAQSATQYMSASEYLAENTDLPRDMELNGNRYPPHNTTHDDRRRQNVTTTPMLGDYDDIREDEF